MMPSTQEQRSGVHRRAFPIGSRVPSVGTYACDTCGTLLDLELEDEFQACEVCLNERTKWKVARLDEFQAA